MNLHIYDIESYPNFWSIVLYNPNSNEWLIAWSFDDANYGDWERLKYIFDNDILIGYNSNNYDIFVFEEIVRSYSARRVHQLTVAIIEQNKRMYNNNLRSIDLATLLFNKIPDSLKMMGIKLRHPKLQELPIKPNTQIKQEQVDLLLSYNKNDVEITYLLYLRLKNVIQQRVEMARADKVNLLSYISLNDAWFADGWIKKTLADLLNTDVQTLKYLELNATEYNRQVFTLDKAILPHIDEKLSEIKEISEWYSTFKQVEYPTVATKNVPTLTMKGLVLSLGYGGIHSEDSPRIIECEEGMYLKDADVSSQYPYKIIAHEIINPKLPNEMFTTFKDKVAYRVNAKKLAEKYKNEVDIEQAKHYKLIADKDKIVINTWYGKYGQKGHPLEDPLSMVTVTVNNQLEIVYLIYQLQQIGIEVLSANTDGFLSYFKEDQLEDYMQICSNWEQEMKMELEYTNYHKLIQLNVNSYIAIPEYAIRDDKVNQKNVKFKGSQFLNQQDLIKGVATLIIPKCLYAYFVEGIEPYEYIYDKSHTIYDFLYAKRVGKQFDVYYGEEQINSMNRFYISKHGEVITKQEGERVLSVLKEEANVLNDVNEDSVIFHSIDYQFYLEKIYNIIKEIMPTYTIIILNKKSQSIRVFERNTKFEIERVTEDTKRMCKDNPFVIIEKIERYNPKTIKNWLNND
jgi:hypothetical protein